MIRNGQMDTKVFAFSQKKIIKKKKTKKKRVIVYCCDFKLMLSVAKMVLYHFTTGD